MKYSDTLRDVAPILAELPYGGEVLRLLADFERIAADGSDYTAAAWCTAEAVYYVGTIWHGGQGCPWYRAECATGYTPGASHYRPERGSIEASATAALLRLVSSHERRGRRRIYRVDTRTKETTR